MDIFTVRVFEAKNLFNEYSQVKNLYSISPTPDNETMLGNNLAQFLRKVIEVSTELESKTESIVERDLLRQFANELKHVFK